MTFDFTQFTGGIKSRISQVETQVNTSIAGQLKNVGLGGGGIAGANLPAMGNNLALLNGYNQGPSEGLTFDTNPGYQMYIVNSDEKVYINAYLPENFEMAIANDYDTPFAQGIIGNGSKLGAALTLSGWSSLTQAMTSQMWVGSKPVSIMLPLVFVANTDPDKDITQPIMALTQLSMPRKKDPADPNSVFLVPPGPKINYGAVNIKKLVASAQSTYAATDAITAGVGAVNQFFDQVRESFTNMKSMTMVQIGTYFRFSNVVIENVSSTYDIVLDANGSPLKASVSLTFSTYWTPIADDLKDIFLRSNTTNSGG